MGSKLLLRVLAGIVLALGSFCNSHADAIPDLARGFAAPPDSAAPRTWWHWANGNVTKEGVTADLEAMQRVGIRSATIVIISYAPNGPIRFNTPAFYDMVKFAASEAKRLGITLGLENCAGWSSSGGPWVTPENSMQMVVSSEKTLAGPTTFSGPLPQPEKRNNYYRDIRVVAFPALPTEARIDSFLLKCDAGKTRVNDKELESGTTPIPADTTAIDRDKMVDLTSKMDATGKLTWEVPAGEWTVLRFGYTTTGVTNHPAPPEGTGLECDKLSRTAARAFWDGMMTKVTQKLGPLAGSTFTHTLIDSYEVGNQNWSPGFAQEFQKRRGYDLLPYLPVFTGRVVQSADLSERVMWDIRRTIADLFADNYFSYFAELAHEAGIKLELEPYGDGPFDDMLSGRDADRVMGEFWWPHGDMYSVKLAASIAHTRGKTIVGAESFTSDDGGWDMSPPTMKTLGDRAFASGINSYTFHRYAMQPWLNRQPGMTMFIYGSNLDRTNTWWEQGKAWIQYISRSQYLLQQGVFVGDVLSFEGEGAPTGAVAPSKWVLPAGYDFDSCDADVILHRLSVKDGRLVLPNGATYRVLVLPDGNRMTPVLLRKIKELTDAGATILGPKPVQSPSLASYPQCDDEVKKLAADLWDSGKITSAKTLPEILGSLKIQPDFQPAQPTGELLYIHRQIGGDDLYFISNQTGTALEADGLFRVSGKAPEFWHADTGRIEKAAAYSEADGRTRVPLRLDPAGSVFVLFHHQAPATPHAVSITRTGGAEVSSDTLVIRRATYGLADNPKSMDVAARLNSLVLKGALHVEASNETFGNDPAPNRVKQLNADYILNGLPGSITVQEGESLDIASPRTRFPDAQLHVAAGNQIELEAWVSGTYAVKMPDGGTRMVPVTTLAQPMEVAGSWALSFPPNWGAPEHVTLEKLIPWNESTDAGVKYFSGTATYTKNLSVPAEFLGAGHRLYLDLGDLQVIAQVKLNGRELGILWKPPYCVEITEAARKGDNALEVKVTNLWPN